MSFAIFGKGAAVADAAADDPDSVVMDSKGFAKLCKEAQIMGGNLDLTRVDLSFTKCSNKVCPASNLHIYNSVNVHLLII